MASVYELDAKISSCIQLDEEHVVSVDDGEILNLQQFEALQMERDAKVEGLACYIKNKLAEADLRGNQRSQLSRWGDEEGSRALQGLSGRCIVRREV